MKRPPIIVIVGHVNHGKTTLLDHIRKGDTASREAGGITQSTLAYEITHKGEKMTFIDTPGHEAFMAMRARGARIADIAVVVIAADDGVQNQTKEAITIVKETGTPFIVAITKIDRAPDLQKIKNDLMQADILLEGSGGTVSWQATSAKTGEGINELLDLIALTATLENLSYDPAARGRGRIIESTKDSQRGVVAHAIALDGTIREGDDIMIEGIAGRVRSLEDFAGKRIPSALPSAPIAIIGLKEMPAVGAEYMIGKGIATVPREKTADAGHARVIKTDGATAINVIIKTDTNGSLEALSQIVRNLPIAPGYELHIVDEGVGEITDGDVQWLTTSKTGVGVLIGFNIRPTKTAEAVAKVNGITIITSSVIYELASKLEETMRNAGAKAITGDLEVLAVFGKKGGRERIVGGRVAAGEIRMNAACGIEREGAAVGVGRVVNLQSQKKDTAAVSAGNECGLLVQTNTEIRTGDHLIVK